MADRMDFMPGGGAPALGRSRARGHYASSRRRPRPGTTVASAAVPPRKSTWRIGEPRALRLRPEMRYTRHDDRVAAQRACRRAGIPARSPRRLWHARATMIRQTFGLEAAKAVLRARPECTGRPGKAAQPAPEAKSCPRAVPDCTYSHTALARPRAVVRAPKGSHRPSAANRWQFPVTPAPSGRIRTFIRRAGLTRNDTGFSRLDRSAELSLARPKTRSGPRATSRTPRRHRN